MINPLQKLFKFEKNELPFLLLKKFIPGTLQHKVKIHINYSNVIDNDKLEYICYTGNTEPSLEYPILQTFHYPFNNINNIFELLINHTCQYLLIKNNLDKDPILLLDDDKYQLEHQIIIGEYRVYNLFSDNLVGINLKKANKIFLKFNKNVCESDFFILCLNSLRKLSGMAGLKYGS